MTESDKVTEDQSDNRVYELGYHIVSSIPEEKLAGEVAAVTDLLGSHGAVVIAEEFPKLKHLSYAITKVLGARHLKFDTAYFGWIKFEMEPAALLAVKKALQGNENILRFIVIKTVRESTLWVPKPPVFRSGEEKPIPGMGDKKGDPMKPAMSEAEMDKTIEALVVE
ncbi:30S ribosomal protein S6 [Patescibacteria group bacterium]|nr:30S ribosomal protein S6 [Patescibacteria group bacterium]